MSQTPPEPPDGPEGQVPADDPAEPDADLDKSGETDDGTPAEETPPPA
jgi:hypothetical protein